MFLDIIQCRADAKANKEPEEQKIPRKLLEIMKYKEQEKTSSSISKKAKSRNKFAQSGMTTQVQFKQGKFETIAHFCKRMDKAAHEAITKAELEVQFDVKFERQGKNKLVVSTEGDPVNQMKDAWKGKRAALESAPAIR